MNNLTPTPDAPCSTPWCSIHEHNDDGTIWCSTQWHEVAGVSLNVSNATTDGSPKLFGLYEVDEVITLEDAERVAHAILGLVATVREQDIPAEATNSAPDQGDVDAVRGLLDLVENFTSNDQRARYLLSSNWLRNRGAQAAARLSDTETETAVGDTTRDGCAPWCANHEPEGWCNSRTERALGMVLEVANDTAEPGIYGLNGLPGDRLSLAQGARLALALQGLIADVEGRGLEEVVEDLTWEDLAWEYPPLDDTVRVGEQVDPDQAAEYDPPGTGGWLVHGSTDVDSRPRFHGYAGLTLTERRQVLANAAALLAGGDRPAAAPGFSYEDNARSGMVSVWHLLKREDGVA